MRHNQRDIKSKRTIKLAKLNLDNLAARRWHGSFAFGKRYCVGRKTLLVVGLCIGLTPITAPATIQLETWQSSGGMAEQGAICAAFSRLMELQSLVDQRIGKLWQERHRYARSVISKAITLEGVEELKSAEINGLVDRYAAWLMTNLTEAGCATMVNGDTHAATTKMIGDVCTKIYQRADQSIIKTHPELADCAVAGNCSDPAAPNELPASQRKITRLI